MISQIILLSIKYLGLTGDISLRSGRRNSLSLQLMRWTSSARLELITWSTFLCRIETIRTKNQFLSVHGSLYVWSSQYPNIKLWFREAKRIGSWDSESGLRVEVNDSLYVFGQEVATLMVVTIEEPPYVMVKCPNCTGNQRYEGFAIDLLNSISKVANFEFYIYTGKEKD